MDSEFVSAAQQLFVDALAGVEGEDYGLERFGLDQLRDLHNAAGDLMNALDMEIDNRISAQDFA